MIDKFEQVLEKLEALDSNQKSIIDQQAHFEKRLVFQNLIHYRPIWLH